MEALLLSFCFISLALSSMFVGFELIRDQRKQKQSIHRKVGLQKNRLMGGAPISLAQLAPALSETASLKPSQKAGGQQSVSRKTKILATLNKQLQTLGYVSPNQQLGFVNRVLNSERATMEEINAHDVRQLFKVIRRYTHSQSSVGLHSVGLHSVGLHSVMHPAKSPQLPQNDIRQATAS